MWFHCPFSVSAAFPGKRCGGIFFENIGKREKKEKEKKKEVVKRGWFPDHLTLTPHLASLPRGEVRLLDGEVVRKGGREGEISRKVERKGWGRRTG